MSALPCYRQLANRAGGLFDTHLDVNFEVLVAGFRQGVAHPRNEILRNPIKARKIILAASILLFATAWLPLRRPG